MNGVLNLEEEFSEFVEVDPTGRYGRYNEILGKGASKTVYRAFDEFEGIEVAWNQVKLYDFLQSPEDLERLYSEIHLLKTLKHKNIMKLYTSWVDTANRNINFVTELFTSGTLRQYRLKHKRVNIRAVKQWCRQILKGLLYLHSHDPPVIHRDLKCDNIFVNGNQGEVKIGDLGLAAILRKSHAAHCVGTPEFMAPEVYEEEYNELVDIYSFGMCILEMITFEYPYSECRYPAQIYKKVISGRRPDALYKVKDPEVRQFIEKCLATVSSRLSAKELLNDPFLYIDDHEDDMRLTDCRYGLGEFNPLMRQPFLEHCTSDSSYINGYSNGIDVKCYPEGYHPTEIETSGIELFEHVDDDHPAELDISIKGKKRDDGSIFLRLRIADKEGRIRNIYFPFDIELDTALSVATEMIAELDISDQDVTSIADIIDGEISSLVSGWEPGPGIEETPCFSDMKLCQNCVSTQTSVGSLLDIPSVNSEALNSPNFECANGCAGALHGRFEEITYQVDGSEHEHYVAETSEEFNERHHAEFRDHCESVNLCSLGSGTNYFDEEHWKSDQYNPAKGESYTESKTETGTHPSDSTEPLASSQSFSMGPLRYTLLEDCESEVQWELRWLKAKYQLQLREVRDHQLGIPPKSSTPRSCHGDAADDRFLESLHQNFLQDQNRINLSKSDSVRNPSCLEFQNRCPISRPQRDRNCEAMKGSNDTKHFFSDSRLPSSLHRSTSLPVDAVFNF